MLVELSIEEAKNTWDNMLLQMSDYNFYQSYSNAMIEGVNGRKPHFLIYYKENKIVAMAMCLKGKSTASIPFGPIFDKDITEEEAKYILNLIQQKLNSNIVFSIESKYFDKFSSMLSSYPVYWEFTTLLLDTQGKTLDDIKNDFNTNRKRILKKCLQEIRNFIVEDDKKYIDDFYKLYMKRLCETGCFIDFNEAYIKNIANQDNTGVVVCKTLDGKIISGIIYYRFGDTLITRHNAFDSEYAKSNPGTIIDYNMIKRVVDDDDLRYYDMSGIATGDDIDQKAFNINRYKQSYGAKKTLTYKWLNYGGK